MAFFIRKSSGQSEHRFGESRSPRLQRFPFSHAALRTMTDRVTLKALSWALRHVQSFGDTDLFPVPFEFDAIQSDWTVLQKVLHKIDLADGRARPAIRMMAPIRYLVKATPAKERTRVGRALCDLLRDKRIGFLPFIQLWTIEAFCQEPAFCPQVSAMRFAEKSSPLIRDRLTAQVAGAYRMLHWVRARKEDWSSLGPWAQRAVIWAGRVLPEDERKHWARSIARSESVDALSRSVAKLVAS